MRLNRTIYLCCAWSGAALAATYLIFLVAVAHWLPPHSPTWSADEVAAVFREHSTRIRIGQTGALVFSFLQMPLWALVTVYIARVELRSQRAPVLALVQFGCAVVFQVFFVMVSIVWLVASYRAASVSPETLRVLDDAGWLMFVMVFPGYVLQMLCIGLAALTDDSDRPVLPRWAGYFHLWVAASGAGGALAVFFKSGPFAWNGLVGFWIPVVVFFAWLVVITGFFHRAIRDERWPGGLDGSQLSSTHT